MYDISRLRVNMPTPSVIMVFSSLFWLIVPVATALLLFLYCADIGSIIPFRMEFIKSQGGMDCIVSVIKLFIAGSKINYNYVF
jgi:hypothetical protein